MPDGLCECGCGELAPISTYTWAARGYVKGQPRRFISGHSMFRTPGGSPLERFNLGWREEDRGYSTPCWIWQNGTDKDGYGRFKVRVGGKGRTLRAHRWRWEQEHGPIPAGLQLDHLCVQPACVRLSHLEPVTPLQNVRRSRLAKLNDAQQLLIYERRSAGESAAVLAEEFGVGTNTVYYIHKNGPHAPRKGSR